MKSQAEDEIVQQGFLRSFVYPALWMFLVPACSLLFFQYAQSGFDSNVKAGMLQDAATARDLTEAQRQEWINVINEVPFSEMLKDEVFADQVDSEIKNYYLSFRWAIRISIACLVTGLLAIVVGAACIGVSLALQRLQYVGLSSGWLFLQVVSTLQVVAQATLLIALAFWLPALFLERYYVRLIVIVAVVALGGAWAVVKAIFKRTSNDFAIQGRLISRDDSQLLWENLQPICDEVGTSLPDQIVVGVEDGFFVTEHPVTVNGTEFTGRTLFASLALLRTLDSQQATAVLAHEMAHFSGNDTAFSRKVSPLLTRYDVYLGYLSTSLTTIPVFHFMHCFRAFFELSLGKASQRREFRADRIASEVTSPNAIVSALLRITAYSEYRRTIEVGLFEQTKVLETVNISSQIEEGFDKFAREYAAPAKLGELQTAHPFDSHPSLLQRAEALGVSLDEQTCRSILGSHPDQRWFNLIDGAETMQHEQWREYELNFRESHETSLAYRYLPNTEEEWEIVNKQFPQVSFEGKSSSVLIDCLAIQDSVWSAPIEWQAIFRCEITDRGLEIVTSDGRGTRTIRLNQFKNADELLATFEKYYGRYLIAKDATPTTT